MDYMLQFLGKKMIIKKLIQIAFYFLLIKIRNIIQNIKMVITYFVIHVLVRGLVEEISASKIII